MGDVVNLKRERVVKLLDKIMDKIKKINNWGPDGRVITDKSVYVITQHKTVSVFAIYKQAQLVTTEDPEKELADLYKIDIQEMRENHKILDNPGPSKENYYSWLMSGY